MSCVACGGTGRIFRGASAVDRDLQNLREFTVRSTREASEPKLMFGHPDDLLRCDTCGSLWRNAAADAVASLYANDSYDQVELEAAHDNDRKGCEQHAQWLLNVAGLSAGPRVLEVGAYAGGFLAFAQAQGFDARGIDVGADAVDFCRSKGLKVDRLEIAAVPGEGCFDSVWILNCFDQLADPRTTLDHAHRLLRPGGRLVLRTPVADFAEAAYEGRDPIARVDALANQLWGVPFLRCYSRAGITRLVTRAELSVIDVIGRYIDDRPGAGMSHACSPWMDVLALRP